MHSIKLPWKSFNVDLQAMEIWAKANLPNYAGNSADYELTLLLTEAPTEYEKTIISDYWTGITNVSAEATYYVSAATTAAAIKALRDGLPSKEWADMSIAERKILLGLTPTKAELNL